MNASDVEAAERPALTQPGAAAGHPVTEQRQGRRRRISGLACGRLADSDMSTCVWSPAFTRRLANPLAMRLNARGVATLTLVGRRTGETRKVPVIPVEVGGSRHLVPPYGGSDWVRNLRASGKGERSRKGRTEAFHAVEVPVDQRGPSPGIAKPPVASRAPGLREAA